MFERVLNIALCSFVAILVELNNPQCTKFVVHLIMFFILPKIPLEDPFAFVSRKIFSSKHLFAQSQN